MDYDQQILERLTNTEDHFTERKSSPQREQCTEAIVAFANSALPNKPGILYVGVDNDGKILDGNAPEEWQIKIGKWANGCYPEIPIIPVSLNKDGKQFLAVVVELSEARPHLPRPVFKRSGAQTIPAIQKEIDEWISYRNSKVRYILEWKDKTIQLNQLKQGTGGLFDESGEYTLLACNPWFVTLFKLGSDERKTFPLSSIDLKMNDKKPDQLMLIFHPYY